MVACVRPERVRLRPPAENGIAGTVKYAGFGGDSIRYVVALEGGTEVMARAPTQDSSITFAVGHAVRVAWAEPLLNCFPE
jgi:ABC-type Fe3+/spermidine/putrescine transport system ATPase subunit